MKRRAAWWWIDRWRKSTAYSDMTLAEQGAYRNLLDELWLRGGVLPNDERILAKVCGDAMAWPSVRPSVMARFTLTSEGWRHPTHDEVAGGSNFHKSQREKGKKGAEARWRGKTPDAPANGPAINKDGPAISGPYAPANGPPMAFRTPSPYSVVRTPSQEPVGEIAAAASSPAITPPQPPATAAIDHDPGDPLQATLNRRCAEIAGRMGDSSPLEVFQAVSTTPGGKALTSMRRASRAWLEETLRACEAFEADLGDEGLQKAGDQQGGEDDERPPPRDRM